MNATPPRPPRIVPRGNTRAPLTLAQESMWFLQQLDPQSNAYNSNNLLKFTGDIEPTALETALNFIIVRHEPLRTIYPNENGSPVQVVQPVEHFSLPVEDLSITPAAHKDQALREAIARIADAPYDLQNGPIVRAALFHLAPDEDVFFVGTHHIGSDGWTRRILLNELLEAYTCCVEGRELELTPLAIQYTDYAAWQREWMSAETLTTFLTHWKELLPQDLHELELPTDRPRPSRQSYRGARLDLDLSGELLARIKEFCRVERITPFHFHLSVFAILLMRYTGQEDLLIGCPFANRSVREVEALVGLFINTLPLHLSLANDPSIRALLDQARRVSLEAFTWQALPFEALVAELSPQRDLGRTPLYQVSINMRNLPGRLPDSIGDTKVSLLTRETLPTPLDLSLEFEEAAGQLTAYLQYNADLFDDSTIRRMSGHYLNLAGELLDHPDARISSLTMLSAHEWTAAVTAPGDNVAEFPQTCLHTLVAQQAARTPHRTAAQFNGRELTYRQLDQQSNRLANYLLKKGLQPGSIVALFLPRSEKCIVAELAILKAGCAFMPLEITLPAERLSTILSDAHPAVILASAGSAVRIPESYRPQCMDIDGLEIDTCNPRPPDIECSLEACCYLMYTSGSTGRPKGVLNVHRGVVNYLTYMVRTFQFTNQDRLLQHTALSYDASVFEIFSMLLGGGTVVMLDEDRMSNPDRIVHALREQHITLLKAVPTLLRAICSSAQLIGVNDFHLRYLISVGEVLLNNDIKLFQKSLGTNFRIVNQYGPTECSGIYTNYVVPDNGVNNELSSVPIGKPMSNNNIYVLDEHLHPVPQGIPGECYLAGIGVGPGYLNQPELTRASFLPDPFHPGGRMYRTGDIVRRLADGNLVFIGRKDNQVKLRGYRVELSEIEAVIAEFPGVRDAAVHVWTKETNDSLAAYITLSGSPAYNFIDSLKKYLEKRLPFYMLPASVTVLEEMPLTVSGKIDRKRLPAVDAPDLSSSSIPPRDETETRLLTIWQDVLGSTGFGVRDNFFQLGGHSLLAIRLLTAVEKAFGKQIPLVQLFEDGTIEGLAKYLTGDQIRRPGGIVPINPQGEKAPIYIVSSGVGMKYLGGELGTSHPVYALFAYSDGKPDYRDTVEETAQIYFKCLTDFDPHGPYSLVGHSADGHFALELARLLSSSGRQVNFLGMIDSYPPMTKPSLNAWKQVKNYLKSMQHAGLQGMAKKVTNSISWRWQRFWNRARGRFLVEKWQRNGEVRRVKHYLMKQYTPEPYHGDVTLFSATYSPEYTRDDLVSEWKKTIKGNLEVIPVIGDHTSVIVPPQVTQLAARILEAIDQYETTQY